MADISTCIPDTPDVQGEVNKAIATAKGKVADIDFRPVDFNLDVSKYFSFEMIGRILGKPDGLGYDMCAICDSGDLDAAIAGSPFPNGAQDTIDGINNSIDAVNDKVDNIEIPENPGTFSLDSAISILYQQIDSVSDIVDSAGI
jgi:hypothetical protein